MMRSWDNLAIPSITFCLCVFALIQFLGGIGLNIVAPNVVTTAVTGFDPLARPNRTSGRVHIPTLSVNIFTNCIPSAPNVTVIDATIRSFERTWNVSMEDQNCRIYLDPHPKQEALLDYKKALEQYCPVTLTRGLADAYIKSITATRTQFAFQLEHDWLFIPERISHPLRFIVDVMNTTQMDHLRFNKRKNVVGGWDRWLKELEPYPGFKCCETPIRSNNPHIIDTVQYRRTILKFINKNKSSRGGVEDVLIRAQREKLIKGGYIYGPLNHSSTVKHLDGREKKKIRLH